MAGHDQRFKLMLREFFPELLHLAVPDRADAFDCATLAWLDQEQFLDPPTGRNVVLDLVARLEMTRPPAGERAGPWLALVNVEIEAEDRAADLRRRIYGYWHALRTRHGLPVLPLAVLPPRRPGRRRHRRLRGAVPGPATADVPVPVSGLAGARCV